MGSGSKAWRQWHTVRPKAHRVPITAALTWWYLVGCRNMLERSVRQPPISNVNIHHIIFTDDTLSGPSALTGGYCHHGDAVRSLAQSIIPSRIPFHAVIHSSRRRFWPRIGRGDAGCWRGGKSFSKSGLTLLGRCPLGLLVAIKSDTAPKLDGGSVGIPAGEVC